MNLEFLELGARIGTLFVPFLFAICVHEFAHAWMAKRKGDDTAEKLGRLTLNPIAHADIIGTLVFPLAAILMQSPLFFGWAKPVPVSSRNLKNPKKDMFWIALAGPLSNIIQAVFGSLIYAFLIQARVYEDFHQFFLYYIQINLFLAVFNLLPIHPLDGGKVLERFLSRNANQWLQQNQGALNMGLLFLILLGGGRILAIPVLITQKLLLGLSLVVTAPFF